MKKGGVTLPYIDTDKETLYYTASNEFTDQKPVLLFCHGAAGHCLYWGSQLQGLSGCATVMALDLPGHGRSTGKAFASISAYRDALHSFVRALNLDSFYLAGHSMGGAIALEYAFRYQDRLAGLILISTGARLRVDPAIMHQCRSGEIPPLAQKLFGPNAPENLIAEGQKEWSRIDPALLLADFTACNNFDLRNSLGGIKTPTLIISGKEDLLTPPKYSRYLQKHLPAAQLELIEGAGHMIMLEKPSSLNRAIRKFLTNRQ